MPSEIVKAAWISGTGYSTPKLKEIMGHTHFARRPAAGKGVARGKSGAWKIPLPDNLGLCELVDRRLDESGRGLVPPNGLLQTLDHVGAQGYLAATVADFSRHVVDQIKRSANGGKRGQPELRDFLQRGTNRAG